MRLFIAINFTEAFRRAILRRQDALRRAMTAGNLSRPENLHMTLAFIGEVRSPAAALRAVESASFEPFALRLSGNGRFGSLYWLGVDSGGRAEALAGELRAALKREGVPFDAKPFRAHVTLAREAILADPAFSMPSSEAAMTVERISLMKSERINGRLIYTEIGGRNARISPKETKE